MGLLDSILGGVAGGALGRSGGMNRRNVMMALLPVVIGMLANRRGGASGGGGLGGLGGMMRSGGLGGLTGSGAGAGLGGLAALGGLGALLHQFQQHGYGDQVNSWIGTGQNQPIPPDAISQVFGHDQVSQIASQAGVSEDEARSGLSELLPHVVDHLTPNGQLPNFDELTSSVDQFQQELAQRGS